MEIGHRDELTPEQRANWDAVCGAMVQGMTALCRPVPPDAKGLSGSLVWNTRLVECVRQHRTWLRDLAKVTGMLVRSDTPLVAVRMVRIEVIRDFLERNSRHSADHQPSNSY